MSLAPIPGAALPSTVMRMRLGRRCQIVCVISTCATSEAPIPKANAPSAPWVEVWLSPQTISRPGSVRPCSGPTTCTIPCRRSLQAEQLDPMLGGVFIHLAHHARNLRIADLVAGRSRRHVMIRHAEGETGLGNRHAALRQPAEGVKRAFMDVVAIDPEQRIAVLAAHDFVRGPKFIDQGLGFSHAGSGRRVRGRRPI